MKQFFGVVALVAAVAVGAGFIPTQDAEAGNVYKSALTSNDAGPSNAVTLTAQREYELLCPEATCYKLGSSGTASSTVPNCANDFILLNSTTFLGVGNTEERRYRELIKSGGFTSIRVRALDGGNVAGCKIYDRVVQ